MDKINARMYFNSNKYIALKHLKAMNKKLAYTVVQNELRKMESIRVFRITNVQIVNVNF
jgi:hypothetical protein